MTKTEFLEHLEERLLILNQKERDDILSEYAQHIELKMENGLCEEDVIRDFGDLDELEAEILDAYNVDPEYGRKAFHFDKNKIKRKVEHVEQQVGSLLKRGGRLSGRINIFWKYCYVTGILFLLYLPLAYAFFRIADCLYRFLSSPFDSLASWGILVLFHFVYVAFSVFALYVFTCGNRRNHGLGRAAEEPELDESLKPETAGYGLRSLVKDLSSRLCFPRDRRERNAKRTGGVLASIWTAIRVFAVLLIRGAGMCIMIPILLLLFGQVIIFGIILVLLVLGYPVIGISIVSFGGLLCGFSFIWFIYNIMSGEKAGKIIITFFIGLLLMGIGIGVGFAEITTFRYGGKKDISGDMTTVTLQRSVPEEVRFILNFDSDKIIIDADSSMPHDQITVEVTCNDNFLRPYITVDAEMKDGVANGLCYVGYVYYGYGYGNAAADLFQMMHIMMEDYRDRTVYTYTADYVQSVTIKMNPDLASHLDIR